MRQNSLQNGRKVIMGVSTHRELVAYPSQFSRNHYETRHICEINCEQIVTNETLRDNIASKLN